MHASQPPELQLPPGEVHLWYGDPAELASDEMLPVCRRRLSPVELARCARFAREHGRQLYLASHAMLRCVLSQYAAVAPEQWKFGNRLGGKPVVTGPVAEDSLRFNLTHTTGLVACAVTRQCEVGIDAESVERQIDLVALAQRFFSPTEAAALASFPAAGRQQRFYQYWTLKEAYIKAVGKGLALSLDSFSMTLPAELTLLGAPSSAAPLANLPTASIYFEPSHVVEAKFDDVPAAWQFAQCLPFHRHVLAVGIYRGELPEQQIVVRRATPALIMTDA